MDFSKFLEVSMKQIFLICMIRAFNFCVMREYTGWFSINPGYFLYFPFFPAMNVVFLTRPQAEM